MAYPIFYLDFADAAGLDRAEFNTLRLGTGWEKRLKKGDRVLLAHKMQIIGSARVSLLLSGPKEWTVCTYARKNHIELAMADELGYDAALAPERRLDSMRRNYGPRSFDNTKSATMILLRRLR